jgi:hypothetical protein
MHPRTLLSLRWSSQAAVHGSLPKMLSRSPSHLALHILFLDRSDPPCLTAAPILPRYRIGGVLRSIEINCIYLFSDTSPILYRKRIGKYRYRIRITIPVRQLGDVSVGWKTGGNRFWDRAVWILLITRMKTLDGDTKQPKCIRVVVLLALRPFCVCGGRDNTLELNCHERFMINKAGESFL